MDRQKKEALVDVIVRTEFTLFDQVNNRGGRADCQDNWPTFSIMRRSQFLAWNEESLESYLMDLRTAITEERNPVAEKYAYMMEYSSPAEFEQIRAQLPEVTAEKNRLVEEILRIFLQQTEAFMAEHPSFRDRSRPVYASGDRMNFTSIETYTRGELKTYSEKTLQAYLKWLRTEEAAGRKTVYEIYTNTARAYGYSSLEDFEQQIRP